MMIYAPQAGLYDVVHDQPIPSDLIQSAAPDPAGFPPLDFHLDFSSMDTNSAGELVTTDPVSGHYAILRNGATVVSESLLGRDGSSIKTNRVYSQYADIVAPGGGPVDVGGARTFVYWVWADWNGQSGVWDRFIDIYVVNVLNWAQSPWGDTSIVGNSACPVGTCRGALTSWYNKIVGGSGQGQHVRSTWGFVYNTWNHIVMSIDDAGLLKVYYNGQLTSRSWSLPWPSPQCVPASPLARVGV